jgi:hypothetical protein
MTRRHRPAACEARKTTSVRSSLPADGLRSGGRCAAAPRLIDSAAALRERVVAETFGNVTTRLRCCASAQPRSWGRR